jgi:hypothetical protein
MSKRNACTTLTILAVLLVIPPSEAHLTGTPAFDVGGFGTPTIDGVISPGEWSAAGVISFQMNLPASEGGGTQPATVYVMNDATNIYFALTFARSPTVTTSFGVEFDDNHNGAQDATEDVFVANWDGGYYDDVRKSNGTAPADVDESGTNDGTAAAGNDGTNTIIEVSKPLNSGDANDFALSAGDTVGAGIFVRIIVGENFPDDYGDTDYPSLNRSLFGDIRIYPLGAQAPVFDQPTSPMCGSTFDQVALKELTFPVAASDPNGDSVTVTATTLPAGATYTPDATDASKGVFAWTPTVAQDTGSSHTIEFTASDGSLSTTCTMMVNVKGDSDNDGLPDAWEMHGYTYNGEFVDLPGMGADPTVPDVFVEIDYMDDGMGDSHMPDATALGWIQDAFTAQGITLHVNVDQAIPHQAVLGSGTSADSYDWTDVDTIKAQIGTGGVAHFSPAKSLSIRYCIFAHDISTNDSGVARGAAGSDFIVALGTFNGEISDQYDQAGTFMHELGHVLGLMHGGDDDLTNKPNYLSVMNYLFQTTGLRKNSTWGTFDYSSDALPTLYETNLDESVGLNAGAAFNAYGTRWILGGVKQLANAVNGPINWNGTGGSSETGVSIDITDDNVKFLPLNGFDDWANLDFAGGTIGTGVPIPQPTVTPAEELNQEIIDTTATPDPLAKAKGHVSKKKLHLTWTPQGPQGSGYSYRVYRSVDGGDYVRVGKTANTNFQDRDVEPGKTYSYQVTWVLDGVESLPTDDITLELKAK